MLGRWRVIGPVLPLRLVSCRRRRRSPGSRLRRSGWTRPGSRLRRWGWMDRIRLTPLPLWVWAGAGVSSIIGAAPSPLRFARAMHVWPTGAGPCAPLSISIWQRAWLQPAQCALYRGRGSSYKHAHSRATPALATTTPPAGRGRGRGALDPEHAKVPFSAGAGRGRGRGALRTLPRPPPASPAPPPPAPPAPPVQDGHANGPPPSTCAADPDEAFVEVSGALKSRQSSRIYGFKAAPGGTGGARPLRLGAGDGDCDEDDEDYDGEDV